MIEKYIIANGQQYNYAATGMYKVSKRSIGATCFSRFQLIDSILCRTRRYECDFSITQIICVLYTHFHILYICICADIVYQRFKMYFTHGRYGNKIVSTINSFLYDLDTFFQKLTIFRMHAFSHSICSSHIFKLLTLFKHVFQM